MAGVHSRFSLDEESLYDLKMFDGILLVVFVDLDTLPTFFTKRKSGIGKEILLRQDNKSMFLVVTGSDFPERYKQGDCFDHLNVNGRIKSYKSGSQANAADLRLIRLLIKTYIDLLPRHVDFTIVSGDKAFREIVEEISKRKMAVVSPHTRHNWTASDIVNNIFNSHPTPSNKSTRFDKITTKLCRVSNLSKLIFVYMNENDLNEQGIIEQHDEMNAHLTKTDTRMLLFESKAAAEKMRRNNPWLEKYLYETGDVMDDKHCFIIGTEDMNKDDAPVFMLVFFALALHYELKDDSKVEFCIITRAAETMPLEEIREGCKDGCEREVKIYSSFADVAQPH